MSGPGGSSMYLQPQYFDHISDSALRQASSEKLTQARTWQKCAKEVLACPGFDYVMGLVIVLNMIIMIIETDRSVNEDASEQRLIHWTEVFGWVVLLIFIFELVVRLLAFQCKFWQDAWNIGDFIIVVIDTIFTVIGIIAGAMFPVTILRVFRLAKLARVSKVLRVFPELKMLLAGLVHSLKAIFWGTLLLMLFLLVWSMIAVMVIHPLNQNVDYEVLGCDRCPRAYSSVEQAGLTLWQQIVTGDSWGQATIPVIEKYPSTALFFIPCFLCLGLSVMNLMLAVVVSSAQAAYEKEGAEEEAQAALIKMKKETSVLELCQKMDIDRSGELSHEEIFAGFSNSPEFVEIMKDLGLDQEDLEIAWSIIDIDKSGAVSYKEFVTFLFTMKGSDMQFILLYLKHHVTWIKDALLKNFEMNTKEVKELAKIESAMTERYFEEAEEQVLEEREDADTHPDKMDPEGVKRERQLRRPSQNQNRLRISRTGTQQSKPSVHVDIDPSKWRDMMQDIVKVLRSDAGRMHLELKDILIDMNSKLCQRISSAPGVPPALVRPDGSTTDAHLSPGDSSKNDSETYV